MANREMANTMRINVHMTDTVVLSLRVQFHHEIPNNYRALGLTQVSVKQMRPIEAFDVKLQELPKGGRLGDPSTLNVESVLAPNMSQSLPLLCATNVRLSKTRAPSKLHTLRFIRGHSLSQN
jgi:hypothetical protein